MQKIKEKPTNSKHKPEFPTKTQQFPATKTKKCFKYEFKIQGGKPKTLEWPQEP